GSLGRDRFSTVSTRTSTGRAVALDFPSAAGGADRWSAAAAATRRIVPSGIAYFTTRASDPDRRTGAPEWRTSGSFSWDECPKRSPPNPEPDTRWFQPSWKP